MKIFSQILNREFEFEYTFCGFHNDKKFPHYKWHCVVNGQGVDYKLGLYYRDYSPQLDGVLHSILLDAETGKLSLREFGREYAQGMEFDEAINVYLACQEMARKAALIGLTQADLEAFSDY